MKSNFLLKRKKLNSSEIKKELIKNKKKKFNSEKLEDIIFIYREKKAKNITFKNYIKENQNKKIKLKIFSLSYQKIKEIEIELNENYDNKEGVLGCEMNYENFIEAQKKIVLKFNN